MPRLYVNIHINRLLRIYDPFTRRTNGELMLWRAMLAFHDIFDDRDAVWVLVCVFTILSTSPVH